MNQETPPPDPSNPGSKSNDDPSPSPAGGDMTPDDATTPSSAGGDARLAAEGPEADPGTPGPDSRPSGARWEEPPPERAGSGWEEPRRERTGSSWEEPRPDAASASGEPRRRHPIEANLTSKSTWLRLVFVVAFAVIWWITEFVLTAVVVVQFLYVLINGEPNQQLRSFGQSLARYAYQIFRYMTFNMDARPFPFELDWPSGEQDPASR